MKRIHAGQKIGKYKIRKKVGSGAFGVVYKAFDEIEGGHVALKIQANADTQTDILRYFKHEVVVMSRVDHQNVLKLKNADVFDGRLFIVSELGKGSLAETRQATRVKFAIDILTQMLAALIEVQKHNIVHRDIKPENIIIFPNNVAKLGDFGIAKVLQQAGRSIATDAGTRGYFAPEQIFGHPSFASDIFSLGLVFYEMVTGELPRWPFVWPFPNRDKFNRRVPPAVRDVIRKSLEFEEADRYANAQAMFDDLQRARTPRNGTNGSRKRMMPWRKYREYEFATRFTKLLELKFRCNKCDGPVSEFMVHCPWCGSDKNSFKGLSSFAGECSKCHHGVKEEWTYCPWCYRNKFKWTDVWTATDKRYIRTCGNRRCGEKRVMRWMHYCPWCHIKLKPWLVPQLDGRCGKCRWSVAGDYWDYCAWCGHEQH